MVLRFLVRELRKLRLPALARFGGASNVVARLAGLVRVGASRSRYSMFWANHVKATTPHSSAPAARATAIQLGHPHGYVPVYLSTCLPPKVYINLPLYLPA